MIDAREYGKALFLLAEEEGTTELALGDIRLVKEAMSKHPTYETLLDTPALPVETKLGLIDEAFAGINANVKNLLKILCEKHATHDMPKVASVFEALYDEAMGIIRAEAITAVALDEQRCKKIRERLEKQTGKTVILSNTVDPSVLGGVKLRYMGKQWDGSLKNRLDAIGQSLQSTALGVENYGK